MDLQLKNNVAIRRGGGIAITDAGGQFIYMEIEVVGVSLQGNSADGGDGGGLYIAAQVTAELLNVVFSGNTAAGRGSAVAVLSAPFPTGGKSSLTITKACETGASDDGDHLSTMADIFYTLETIDFTYSCSSGVIETVSAAANQWVRGTR